jgi:hypothetical protein
VNEYDEMNSAALGDITQHVVDHVPSATANTACVELFGELVHQMAVVLDWSRKVDAEGAEGAMNPVYFAASLTLKRDLAETCRKAIRATIGVDDFGQTVLRKIADAVLDAIDTGGITDDDREHLRYALGLSDAARRPIRNHYLAAPDDAAMVSMIERGLMRTDDVCYRGWQFFHATHAGAAAIGQVLPDIAG